MCSDIILTLSSLQTVLPHGADACREAEEAAEGARAGQDGPGGFSQRFSILNQMVSFCIPSVLCIMLLYEVLVGKKKKRVSGAMIPTDPLSNGLNFPSTELGPNTNFCPPQGEYEFSTEIMDAKLAEIVYRNASAKVKGKVLIFAIQLSA